MIGSVAFTVPVGRAAVAILNDDLTWACAFDQFVPLLNAVCGPEINSVADGRRGAKQLLKAAKILDGAAAFRPDTTKPDLDAVH